MPLTLEEIRLILRLIAEKYGAGYAKERDVARLQAKLSMMAEAKTRVASMLEKNNVTT